MPDKFKNNDTDTGAENIDIYVTNIAYETSWEAQAQRKQQHSRQANEGDSFLDLGIISDEEVNCDLYAGTHAIESVVMTSIKDEEASTVVGLNREEEGTVMGSEEIIMGDFGFLHGVQRT